MLERCKNARERWGGVHTLIDKWLDARRKLVLAFDELGAEPGALAEKREPLQDFCVVLVDYVSAGHLSIYTQLTKEAEAFEDKRGLEFAETLYPRIDVITGKLLAFNDLCDEGKCVAEKFKELGGLLHERFELEDCLIEVLHNAHKEEPAIQV
ncbi:Rsd/AlgQ family anti-sigma factor [Pseudomonas orientalis]|uniref:Regulator of RpoD, Rsd/AlgQ n=1 Tax=Pseudomonas orientalis TaxID=76758 RepID=A0A1H2GCU6_9PSED|nr:Rsd/AlgQ family anti-sigma factor [Pseudomonas orientalis]KRP65320.1 transcriptional regulator [Pseudomonas orientalis]SDU17385.1 regulator of RpoD, Rsd/AlgQ [Pseudomonas orientalis]